MTDEPLMNDDDIYADDYPPIIHEPIETRIGRITYDPNAVYVDRALLVRLARFVCTMETAVVFRTADLDRLITACKQILREHGE
jgi:hypothetical protein